MHKRGFTLLEVMLVAGLIGILTSLAFSNIQEHRNKAQKYACITNLRSIESNIALWALNDGKKESDTVQMSDLVPAYLRSTPYCPLDTARQGYILTTVSEKPVCPRDPENHFIN